MATSGFRDGAPLEVVGQAGLDQAVLLGRTRSGGPHRLRDLAVVLTAFAVGACLIAGYATYRVWEQGSRDDARPSDAIVVLGAAQWNGVPTAVLAARLDHAIELYKQGLAPYFVVTGGKQPGDVTTEAATERAYAVARGVPESAILAEDRGRTTLESLQAVRRLLVERGLGSALFVSDRTHMLRVLRIARDQGIAAAGSPTSTSPADTDPHLHLDSMLHELGALALYFTVEQPRVEPSLTSQAAAVRAP